MTKITTIIVSIIWGLGIACLLKNKCKNGECVIVEYNNNKS